MKQLRGMPKIQRIQIIPPIEFTKKGIFFGFDPGTTHMGIAVLDTCSGNPECTLFQVNLERSDDPVTRVITTGKILSYCVNWSCFPMYACIEGASFGDRYRQVELAEVRAAAMIWCERLEYKTRVIPPLVIRKELFGNGGIKADAVWTNVPADAANALACSYWAVLMAGE